MSASSCAGEDVPWRHESSRSALAWAPGPCRGPARALLMIVCMERDWASCSPVHPPKMRQVSDGVRLMGVEQVCKAVVNHRVVMQEYSRVWTCSV